MEWVIVHTKTFRNGWATGTQVQGRVRASELLAGIFVLTFSYFTSYSFTLTPSDSYAVCVLPPCLPLPAFRSSKCATAVCLTWCVRNLLPKRMVRSDWTRLPSALWEEWTKKDYIICHTPSFPCTLTIACSTERLLATMARPLQGVKFYLGGRENSGVGVAWERGGGGAGGVRRTKQKYSRELFFL